MPRKHHKLRAEMSRHFIEYVEYHLEFYIDLLNDSVNHHTSSVQKAAYYLYKSWVDTNMREAWKLTKIYVDAVERGQRRRDVTEGHKRSTKLYKAGVRYYSAKNPKWGKRMMLEKLSR